MIKNAKISCYYKIANFPQDLEVFPKTLIGFLAVEALPFDLHP